MSHFCVLPLGAPERHQLSADHSFCHGGLCGHQFGCVGDQGFSQKSRARKSGSNSALDDQLNFNVFYSFLLQLQNMLIEHFTVYLLKNKVLLINFLAKTAINSCIFRFIPGLFHKAAL